MIQLLSNALHADQSGVMQAGLQDTTFISGSTLQAAHQQGLFTSIAFRKPPPPSTHQQAHGEGGQEALRGATSSQCRLGRPQHIRQVGTQPGSSGGAPAQVLRCCCQVALELVHLSCKSQHWRAGAGMQTEARGGVGGGGRQVNQREEACKAGTVLQRHPCMPALLAAVCPT